MAAEACLQCSKRLRKNDRALFVEEENCRIFCSEDCIADFFAPEVGRLEKEYFKNLAQGDLTDQEREAMAHLRWVTLDEPDEVWREKTLSGDFRYTLISEFKPSSKSVWCICICLFLRGEPSFLFLAFPTRNSTLVDRYRRGERVEWARGAKKADNEEESEEPEAPTDGLADAWTEDETLRAQLSRKRSPDDIPAADFDKFQRCLDSTVESPDEVWSMSIRGEGSKAHLYHFIKEFTEEGPSFWYVVAARETDDDEQLEILDAFPTRDASLVDRHRQGEQQLGAERQVQSRLVH